MLYLRRKSKKPSASGSNGFQDLYDSFPVMVRECFSSIGEIGDKGGEEGTTACDLPTLAFPAVSDDDVEILLKM